MKNKKFAKYALFATTTTGADYMVCSRDNNGNPLMTYEESQSRLNEFSERHTMRIVKL